MNFSTLPNLAALAMLVAVFWAISRKETAERLHLWLAGWFLVLLHFAAQFFIPESGAASNWLVAASLDCLMLASVAFLISVSRVATNWQRQLVMALAVTIPCLAYVNATVWEVHSAAYYYFVIACGVVGPLEAFRRLYRKLDLYAVGVVAATLISAAAAAWAVRSGNADLGETIILTVLNLSAAVLYWRHHERVTAGVLTTVAGFVLWALVFPTSALFALYMPSVKVESEVWNIPKYLVALGMILTLLEDQIVHSNYLAYHDELTGLPNRRLLDDRLDQALAHARRVQSKVAVLLLDLDHFKEVNDSFGHRVGDMTLQTVVAQLTSRIRTSDTLARSGGDEFTVVSEVVDEHGAAALVAALESALSTPLLVQGVQVRTGLSIGLALYPDDGTNPDQLHAAADKAMYVAKRATRNSVLNANRRLDEITSPLSPGIKAQTNYI
jgi:diguanylate cyclase (GGDEF)-like protein